MFNVLYINFGTNVQMFVLNFFCLLYGRAEADSANNWCVPATPVVIGKFYVFAEYPISVLASIE
jgi:hypothetical protein